jgi:tripartite-type tricarboxylate transporter receptor subunit TctC
MDDIFAMNRTEFLRRLGAVFLGAGFAGVAARSASAQSAEQFYKGRTVTLIIGTARGGINDLSGRLVAKQLGRFIPGGPSVVAVNRAEGGGLALANSFADTKENDGSVIAIIQRGIAQLAIQGDPHAKFDPLKLTWLGSLSSFATDAYILVVNAPSARP